MLNQKLRRLIDRLDQSVLKNRVTTLVVDNKTILVKRNHELRAYLKKYFQYAQNVKRVTKAVVDKYPTTTIIDVGANIGDTAAFMRNATDAPIACIEGEEAFLPLLKENAATLGNIDVFGNFLGEKTETIHAVRDMHRKGSMTLKTEADATNSLSLIAFDDFVRKNNKYANAKLFMSDTDGYDFKVLRGAAKYLASVHPVLFFEYARFLLQPKNEDGLQGLKNLRTFGYKTAIFYDNIGRMLLSTDLTDDQLLEQLYLYTRGKSSSIAFYDVCVFHSADQDIADKLVKEELEVNKK